MMPDGFIKINKHSLFGIEDGDGRTILPTLYRLIKFSDTGDVITVQDNDYRYGLFNKEGKEIVQIGKYSFICQVDAVLPESKYQRTNGASLIKKVMKCFGT